MKGALVFPMALLLAGCGPTKEQAMGACHVNSLRTYPQEEGPYSTKVDDFDRACMASKGFHFDAAPSDCGHGDSYQDPNCYEAGSSK